MPLLSAVVAVLFERGLEKPALSYVPVIGPVGRLHKLYGLPLAGLAGAAGCYGASAPCSAPVFVVKIEPPGLVTVRRTSRGSSRRAAPASQ
jgi:hypothetical protein